MGSEVYFLNWQDITHRLINEAENVNKGLFQVSEIIVN